jgi:hypothetical protein
VGWTPEALIKYVGPLLLMTVADSARFSAPGLRPCAGKSFPAALPLVDCLPVREPKEGAMPEPNRDDLLGRIESLERANRRWKRLAAGLLAAPVLLLSVIGAFVAHQYERLMAARQEVEQAVRAAEAEREKAEENFQRARQAAEEALKRLEQ